jgi:hypothetical protein
VRPRSIRGAILHRTAPRRRSGSYGSLGLRQACTKDPVAVRASPRPPLSPQRSPRTQRYSLPGSALSAFSAVEPPLRAYPLSSTWHGHRLGVDSSVSLCLYGLSGPVPGQCCQRGGGDSPQRHRGGEDDSLIADGLRVWGERVLEGTFAPGLPGSSLLIAENPAPRRWRPCSPPLSPQRSPRTQRYSLPGSALSRVELPAPGSGAVAEEARSMRLRLQLLERLGASGALHQSRVAS